jgi:hypothetical protein
MPEVLSPSDFTAQVAERLEPYRLSVSTPEPLLITVLYGEHEPVLTLKLEQIYEEYQKDPEKLSALVQPMVTEVGWTVNGTRYSFTDIAESSFPLMRDLLRNPLTEEESGAAAGSKGPLLFQELVKREEEQVIVQFVMAKNGLVKPLFTGDMLRSYPEPEQFTGNAVRNLRALVLGLGLTLSEYKMENINASPWLVGLRGGSHREFLASLITVPEVMRTLQQTLNAPDGLVAILPSREQLLVSAAQDEDTIVEMGLLAQYLKEESQEPVSSFIWHFNEGLLKRVQTIDVRQDSSQN